VSTKIEDKKTTCYEILHAGEGPRGRSVEIVGSHLLPIYCAERAADYFDDIEKRRDDLANSDLDGTHQVIEVDYHNGETLRFRVSCTVVRRYDAEPWPAQKEVAHVDAPE
jgi:hypothetical protein